MTPYYPCVDRVKITIRALTGRDLRVTIPQPFPAALVYVMPAKPNTREPASGPVQVRQGDVVFLHIDDPGRDPERPPRYALDEATVPQDDPTIAYVERHCSRCDLVAQWCFVPPVTDGQELMGVTSATPAYCMDCYEKLAAEGELRFGAA